jgi:hypothetical protein
MIWSNHISVLNPNLNLNPNLILRLEEIKIKIRSMSRPP